MSNNYAYQLLFVERLRGTNLMPKISGLESVRSYSPTALTEVAPVIDRRYPLSELPEALRYLEDGKALGKVVITV